MPADANNDPVRSDPVGELRERIAAAATGLGAEDVGDRLTLERPPKAELGDYSTNAAMLLAPALGGPPRDIAERLREALSGALGDGADRVEVAGPGFVNFFLADRWYREATSGIVAAGARFGSGEAAALERILIEFVSANPTGPITVAAARGASYGDSLARILEFAGHRIEREYYVNDAGTQVANFAASIAARMRGESPAEGEYTGEYVGELADRLLAEGLSPDEPETLQVAGIEAMRRQIETTLERYRVHFDTWSSERRLQEAGALEAAIATLRERGHVYESEGATWFRTTTFGDDKDRVLIRSDGEATYFATDIAYHRDKLSRGFDHLITPLGGDHHGYVGRMKAALEALGYSPDTYEAPIMQLVNIVEGGQRARMSKRKGEFITLDALIDDIGVDAARYFMVQRSQDTTLDLDLELARSTSQDNPVYYVQYAHARIASILRKAEREGGAELGDAVALAAAGLAAPAEPAERALVRRLLELPAEVGLAAERRAPHRLCAYAAATAADFHAFYRDCRVVGAEPETERARLALCLAAKQTIATTLDLLGVEAPDEM